VSASATPHAVAAIKAGVAYFVLVFIAGFVLGTIRTLFLAPRIGALGAVLTELPLMLIVARMTCLWLVTRFDVGAVWTERLLMGAVAFILLMAAELILSLAAFDRTVAGFVADLGTPEGAVGLAGQVAFAAMPLLVGRRSTRSAQ
jgi:hypothetical protein